MNKDTGDTKRILLLADHRQRDLLPLSVLKALLDRNKDALVSVTSFDLWRVAIEGFMPHVVVLNHLHGRRNEMIADFVKRQGGRVAVLPTEGRPNTDALMQWATREWDHALCDLYLCWSEEIKRALPEGVNPVVVGCNRFDFYTEPFNKLVPDKETVCVLHGIDPTRQILTVASSFPQAKFATRAQQFNVQDWKDLGMTRVAGREDPLEFARQETEYLALFREFLLYMMVNRPEVQLVIKPHPGEDVKGWRNWCQETGAILFLNEPVYSLLKISDKHIARQSCITLPEAWRAGVDTLQVCFKDEGSGAATDAQQYGVLVKPQWDFEPRTAPAAAKSYLAKWFNDSGHSLEQTADALWTLALSAGDVTRPVTEKWVNFHLETMRHDKYNREPVEDVYGHSGKAITFTMVAEWVQKARELL